MTRGRPSVLDGKVLATLVNELAGGRSRKEAAAASGVSLRTLQGWIAAGAELEDGPHHELAAAAKAADLVHLRGRRRAAARARFGR